MCALRKAETDPPPHPSDVSDMCEGNKQILARLAISYTVGHVNCMASAPQGVKLLFTAHCTLYNNPLVLPVGQFWRIAVNQIKGRRIHLHSCTTLQHLRPDRWNYNWWFWFEYSCGHAHVKAQLLENKNWFWCYLVQIQFIYAQREFLFLCSRKREYWHFSVNTPLQRSIVVLQFAVPADTVSITV